jgi:hypothetical protein
MKDLHELLSTRKLVLLLCVIGCAMLISTIVFPLESRGGAEIKAIPQKLEEAKIPFNIGEYKHLNPVYITAEIVSLTVKPQDDVYIGEAYLQPFNHEELGSQAVIAVIPSNRVQRMFELAMTRELNIECWGYKIPSVPGHFYNALPFYQIISAEVFDSNVSYKASALIEP